ncbi:C2H2-type domain-containing protein [Trichostrongylus colubriformis]|uniref:C2H2-type domain-containing protein n=1 Tax=Trichostrongylus colubriformis TaxID=6319 RepID=A0AAN8ER88_TRICO
MSGETTSKDLIADLPLPNWELIDEVSITLLESGLARFSTLQAVLPTMLSFDVTSDEASQRSRKLLRISQIQTEYLLKSQNELVQQIQKLKSDLISKKKEVKRLKAAVLNEDTPLFKCSTCGKVFVNQDFLASHLKRRHNNEK